jgi:hypothetical protein
MKRVDVRRALLDELSQIQDREVALLLSGGIGSQSVLFALLELEKTVTCYTFTLDDRQSTDFVNAKRTAQKFASAFVPVYLPTDVDVLRADLRTLRSLGAVSKTDYECGWPMLYAYQQIGERQIVSGLGDDDHFAISKKAMIHYKDRIQEYRDHMMFDVGAPRLTIFDALTDAGYSVRYKVLNARDYGVAQSRERVIFIGVRNDIQRQITYPSWRSNRVTVRDAIHDLRADVPLDEEHKKLSDLQHTSWLHMKPGESMADYGARTAQKISGFTRIRIDADEASPTVVTDPELFHYAEPRTLKIAEVKRLCSFPDDYYLGDKFVDKWERLGRSVPPFMMKAVAEHVYQTILKDEALS